MKTIKEVQKEISDNAKEIIRLNKDIDDRIEVKRNKSFVKRLKKKESIIKTMRIVFKNFSKRGIFKERAFVTQRES